MQKFKLPLLFVLTAFITFIILFGINLFYAFRVGHVNKNNTDNIQTDQVTDNKLIVLISLDGMRSDMVTQDMPYLNSLLGNPETSYTLDMLSLVQSETMPSHISMVTGLSQEHHGFYANDVTNSTPILTSKTVFDYASEQGYSYFAFVTKEKLLYLLGGKTGPNIVFEEALSGDIIDDIDNLVETNTENVFVFIHLRDMDNYGHTYGWYSIIQKEAAKVLDQNLNLLISDFEQEFILYERYFIITADHGGEGTQHSNGCPACRTIPLIVKSENTTNQYILDHNSYNIYDVACAALGTMGVTDNTGLDCMI